MKKTLISLALIATLSGCNQPVNFIYPDEVHDIEIGAVFYRGRTYNINDPELKDKRIEYNETHNAYDKFITLLDIPGVSLNSNLSDVLAQTKKIDGMNIITDDGQLLTIQGWGGMPNGIMIQIQHENDKITMMTSIRLNYSIDECMDYIGSTISESLNSIGQYYQSNNIISKSNGLDISYHYEVYVNHKKVNTLSGICSDGSATFRITH